MLYSKRLTSPFAHVVFVAFVLFVVAFGLPVWIAQRPIFPIQLGLVIIFTVVGTAGWHYVEQRGRPSFVFAYFTIQSGLLILIMLLEILPGGYGLAAASLGGLLILQASVLPLRWRLGFFALMVTLTTVFSLHGVNDPASLFSYFISYLLGFGLMLVVGVLIVGEERANQKTNKLARYATEVEELATLRERNRLAREIHDNLGHYLTAVNIQLEAALALLDSDHERTRSTLQKAQGLTKDGLEEIRRSIQALRASPIENRSLPEALSLLVEEHLAAGYPIGFAVEGEPRPYPVTIEMAVYRAVQEGLTNVRKHAQAAQTRLRLSYQDTRQIEMELQDNGGGSADPSGGFGLIGLHERVQMLGGKLTIQTSPGHGFTLQVIIPA